VKLRLAGRTDLEDLRALYLPTLHRMKDLPLYPYLVFIEEGEVVAIKILYKTRELLELPDDTRVMLQWPGQWRSDWFQLTVGDIRAAGKGATP
jgi:hypothetical protein